MNAEPRPESQVSTKPLGPAALVVSASGERVFIACADASQVLLLETASGQVLGRMAVPSPPSGLALSADERRLYVTCAAPSGRLCVIDVEQRRVMRTLPVGHTPMAPVLSPDEATLYVCNRFENDVAILQVPDGGELARVPVSREPVAAAITPDGKSLLVANHIYDRATDGPGVRGTLSIIDTETRRVVHRIDLPRGSGFLRGVAVSPDGRFAAVTHLLARYYLPTRNVEAGRINANVVSVIDLSQPRWLWIVPLDEEDRGGANPWGVAWTGDGNHLVVTQSGTHEIAVIDAPRLPQRPVRVSQRVALTGRGPRSIATGLNRVYVANYFSDSVSVIDLASPRAAEVSRALSKPTTPSLARQGEMWFNDATLCHQQRQSCASCHGAEGRMDGLNWDLLNDGLGNPKNAKSLLLAHQTPPAMWLGVRKDAASAVRAGIRHILFAEPSETVATALDAYLQSLRPVPSPHLEKGQLSAAAERGRRLFQDPGIGCALCHPAPLFSDLCSYNVGTQGRSDQGSEAFDTPSLVELWRTAPYLHDGSAATVDEVIAPRNPEDQHGFTSHLSAGEIEDLTAYLLSL